MENRCRFALEVVKAVTDEVGSDRVGIRYCHTHLLQVAAQQHVVSSALHQAIAACHRTTKSTPGNLCSICMCSSTVAHVSGLMITKALTVVGPCRVTHTELGFAVLVMY